MNIQNYLIFAAVVVVVWCLLADEVFLTGTAAEVTPVREIDDRSIGSGKPGPITQRIQQTFFAATSGQLHPYSLWLTPI